MQLKKKSTFQKKGAFAVSCKFNKKKSLFSAINCRKQSVRFLLQVIMEIKEQEA